MTEESADGLPGPFPATATVARLLGGSEAASRAATAVSLTLPLALALA